MTAKPPPFVGHEILQLEYPAAPVTAPTDTSPAAAQPEPTQVPAGSATAHARKGSTTQTAPTSTTITTSATTYAGRVELRAARRRATSATAFLYAS